MVHGYRRPTSTPVQPAGPSRHRGPLDARGTAPLNASDAILARVPRAGAARPSGGPAPRRHADLRRARRRGLPAANALAALGLKRGERVCLLMNDSPRPLRGVSRRDQRRARSRSRSTRGSRRRSSPTRRRLRTARLAIADPEHPCGRERRCEGTATRLVPALGGDFARGRRNDGPPGARHRDDARRRTGVLAVFLRHDRPAEGDHPQPGELRARRQAPARGRPRRRGHGRARDLEALLRICARQRLHRAAVLRRRDRHRRKLGPGPGRDRGDRQRAAARTCSSLCRR